MRGEMQCEHDGFLVQQLQPKAGGAKHGGNMAVQRGRRSRRPTNAWSWGTDA